MKTRHNPNMTRIAGFTLLEAMIALLIFSVGLLGLAGLQAGSLKNSKVSDWRSIAIIAAHDMANRITANNRGADVSTNSPIYTNITTAPSGPVNCVTTANCTQGDLEQWDAYEWETYLANNLPSGAGTVKTLAGGGYEITVSWDEGNTGAANKSYKTDILP